MKTFIEWVEGYRDISYAAFDARNPLEIDSRFSKIAKKIEFSPPSILRVTFNNDRVVEFQNVKYEVVLRHSRSRPGVGGIDVLIRRLQARDSYLRGRDEPILDS